MRINRNKKRTIRLGFTLIELLVIMAIIGLLASIVLVALNNARVKSRDAKRLGDFHSIKGALEIYFTMNNAYPPTKPQTSCGGASTWADSIGTCGGQWLTTDAAFYCGTREAFYHATQTPWCPPWPGNMSRSQSIYTDH